MCCCLHAGSASQSPQLQNMSARRSGPNLHFNLMVRVPLFGDGDGLRRQGHRKTIAQICQISTLKHSSGRIFNRVIAQASVEKVGAQYIASFRPNINSSSSSSLPWVAACSPKSSLSTGLTLRRPFVKAWRSLESRCVDGGGIL